MAGDWIPMRHDIADDPAVICISEATGLDRYGVVGRLHRVWSWFDSVSRFGHASVTQLSWIDHLVERDGFATAMISAGWLVHDSSGMSLPNFDRWISQSAKQRVLATRRKRSERSRKCHGARVTKTGLQDRTEEYITPTPLDAVKYPDGFDTIDVRQALSDWLAYKATRRETYKQPAKQLSLLLAEGWATPAAFVAAVKRSMARNYQGVFAERPNGKPEPKQHTDGELPLRN
jgi:hypothetical protein